jgi:Flp pilus assembly protein TadD
MTRTTLFALCLALMPLPLLAAGSDDSSPPKPTETTTRCWGKKVWDPKTRKCVKPEDTGLNDDQRYQAARELAWAGRPEDALAVLAAMTEGDTDRVMTYKGFALRKLGRWEEGRAAYEQAIALNPRNNLARSYFGQGLVERGDRAAAIVQLAEIRAHDGTGTWAETALAQAIELGITTSY